MKLSDLGQNADGLSHVEDFVKDDPNFKLSFPEYREDWGNNIQWNEISIQYKSKYIKNQDKTPYLKIKTKYT